MSHGPLEHAHGTDVTQEKTGPWATNNGPWDKGRPFEMSCGQLEHTHGTDMMQERSGPWATDSVPWDRGWTLNSSCGPFAHAHGTDVVQEREGPWAINSVPWDKGWTLNSSHGTDVVCVFVMRVWCVTVTCHGDVSQYRVTEGSQTGHKVTEKSHSHKCDQVNCWTLVWPLDQPALAKPRWLAKHLLRPMVHLHMPMGQMWHMKGQDHGQHSVSHGTMDEHLICPMVYYNMPKGQMWCKKGLDHGQQTVSHGPLQHAHGTEVMEERIGPWETDSVPWDKGGPFETSHGPLEHTHGTEGEH